MLSHLPRQLRIGLQLLDAAGDRGGLRGDQERAFVVDDLGKAAFVDRDQRLAGGQCLDRDDAERLSYRDEDAAETPFVEESEITIAQARNERDTIRDADPIGNRTQIFLLGT